jgi:DNA-binding transcriptional ArsR family regulator
VPKPSALRVRFGVSTAAELLVSLAALADPAWRDTFDGGAAELRLATGKLGRPFVRRAARFGRFGFLNLLGVLPATREPHTVAALLQWVRRTPSAELHAVLVGGRRRQVREVASEATVAAAVAGDPAARRTLRAALATGRTVVGVSRWLLLTPSPEVRNELVAVLTAWRDARLPPAAERALRDALDAERVARRARSRDLPPDEVIGAVAGGLRYDPSSLPRTVLLLPTPAVRPIVVVVDDVSTHVIAYAPARAAAPRDRLLALARAIGDETRLRILELLRDGPLTAVALADAAGAPRTTLLHHLAQLRAAGLLTTSVGANNATHYALRPDALHELRDAAVTVLR